MLKRHATVLVGLAALSLLALAGTAAATTPVLVGGGSHSAVIRSDGTLWVCGANGSGQLGLGDLTARPTFTQVGTSPDWLQVSTGFAHTAAIARDHSLYTWGLNTQGRLGLGDAVQRTAPTRVGTDTDWTMVSCSQGNPQGFTLAVKANGTLWAWGDNQWGQLGDGTVVDKASPIRIGADNDWAAVEAGNSHALAAKRDGSLWAWGRNNAGQLGDNTTTDVHAPQLVDTAVDWIRFGGGNGSMSAGLKANGRLWTWGSNANGQLAVGDDVQRRRPTAVGTASDWATFAVGGSHLVALKRDRSLWAAGNNGQAQLGLGDLVNRTSFIQVGGLRDWVMVGAGNQHSLGARADGLLYAWGNNTSGQLGFGAVSANVPVPTANAFKVDVTGPITRPARNVIVKHGRKVKLSYTVYDEFTPTCVNVRIRIRKGSRIVKTFRVTQIATGQVRSITFQVKLPKGLYRYYVYANDTAGNAQSALGFKNLRVR